MFSLCTCGVNPVFHELHPILDIHQDGSRTTTSFRTYPGVSFFITNGMFALMYNHYHAQHYNGLLCPVSTLERVEVILVGQLV